MAGATPSFIEAELRSTDTRRHWSSASQAYAPGDVLVRHLVEGWAISPIVGLEEYFHAGVRRVDIYHFELLKDDRTLTIPVQSNPVVRRLITERNLRVVMLSREG